MTMQTKTAEKTLITLALLLLPGLAVPHYPVTMEVTAYAPLDPLAVEGMCHDGNPEMTAIGTRPAHGTVAVNPKIIPYGTEMYISGYGWGRAEDTGGLIRERHDLIDVFVETQKEALEWGRQRVTVWIPWGMGWPE